MTQLLARFLLGCIAFYRRAISPWVGPHCRFAPTCSVYAKECIMLHGPFRGSQLALARLARCHPFHRGGLDRPPPISSQKGA